MTDPIQNAIDDLRVLIDEMGGYAYQEGAQALNTLETALRKPEPIIEGGNVLAALMAMMVVFQRHIDAAKLESVEELVGKQARHAIERYQAGAQLEELTGQEILRFKEIVIPKCNLDSERTISATIEYFINNKLANVEAVRAALNTQGAG